MDTARYILGRMMDELTEAKDYMMKALEHKKAKSVIADEYCKIANKKLDIVDSLNTIAMKNWEDFHSKYKSNNGMNMDNSSYEQPRTKDEHFYEVKAMYKLVNDTYIKVSNEIMIMHGLYKNGNQ